MLLGLRLDPFNRNQVADGAAQHFDLVGGGDGEAKAVAILTRLLAAFFEKILRDCLLLCFRLSTEFKWHVGDEERRFFVRYLS